MSAAILLSISLYLWIINAINAIGMLYTLIIFIWALFSWFPNRKGVFRDIYKVLDKLAGSFVRLFKRFLPPFGGIDFSPLLALIVVQIATRLLALLFGLLFSYY